MDPHNSRLSLLVMSKKKLYLLYFSVFLVIFLPNNEINSFRIRVFLFSLYHPCFPNCFLRIVANSWLHRVRVWFRKSANQLRNYFASANLISPLTPKSYSACFENLNNPSTNRIKKKKLGLTKFVESTHRNSDLHISRRCSTFFFLLFSHSNITLEDILSLRKPMLTFFFSNEI